MNQQNAGSAENLILEHFQPRAIQYVTQASTGRIIVLMNTPANTALAKSILRNAGYQVV